MKSSPLVDQNVAKVGDMEGQASRTSVPYLQPVGNVAGPGVDDAGDNLEGYGNFEPSSADGVSSDYDVLSATEMAGAAAVDDEAERHAAEAEAAEQQRRNKMKLIAAAIGVVTLGVVGAVGYSLLQQFGGSPAPRAAALPPAAVKPLATAMSSESASAQVANPLSGGHEAAPAATVALNNPQVAVAPAASPLPVGAATQFPAPALPSQPVATPAAAGGMPVAVPAAGSDPVARRLDGIEQQMAQIAATLNRMQAIEARLAAVEARAGAPARVAKQEPAVAPAVAAPPRPVAVKTAAVADNLATPPAKPATAPKSAAGATHPMPAPTSTRLTLSSMNEREAWVSANGETIRVRVGDSLPGLGVVRQIDPVKGTLSASGGTLTSQ